MKRIALFLGLLLALAAPAQAAFTPVYTVYSSGFGTPGGNRISFGTITFGSADTYVTGGFTITPANLGFNQVITQVVFAMPNTSAGPYFIAGTAGGGTVKFSSPTATSASSTPTATIVTGASNMTAAATTATVTGLSGLSANTPIFCQLNDAATGGGGTGTWGVTVAVASCKFASSSSFTLTTTAAAPTNNGNFVYWIGVPPTISTPTITNTQASAEMSSGATLASLTVPFVAIGY